VDELSGKVAFVTGSAGGIGRGIARACLEAGMKVVLADLDEGALEQSAAELNDGGAGVMTVALDVTDRDGWARAARDVSAAMGPVQLLVNNAGVSVSTLGLRLDETGPELWDRVVGINLTGVYNGVRTFLGGMRAAGAGHIVSTSSMAGLLGGASMLAPYCASKFAVVGFSEALRAEVAEDGIGVSVLCPGGVRTELWRSSRAVLGLPEVDELSPELSSRSASTASDAMDPYEVGLRVIEGVVADEPYIFTDATCRDDLNGRHQRLLDACDRAEAFSRPGIVSRGV
jgi:NAD(P)-dependent dehydrogenase (short-subunit alcohol dehydrogenase family)